VIPPFGSFPVAIAFAHRAWAFVVAAFVVATAVAALRSGRPGLSRAAVALVFIVVVQIALGAATVLLRKPVALTTAHVATGALLLGASVALAVASLSRRRLAAVPSQPAGAKVLAWK
jgi:heme A synthase